MQTSSNHGFRDCETSKTIKCRVATNRFSHNLQTKANLFKPWFSWLCNRKPRKCTLATNRFSQNIKIGAKPCQTMVFVIMQSKKQIKCKVARKRNFHRCTESGQVTMGTHGLNMFALIWRLCKQQDKEQSLGNNATMHSLDNKTKLEQGNEALARTRQRRLATRLLHWRGPVDLPVQEAMNGKTLKFQWQRHHATPCVFAWIVVAIETWESGRGAAVDHHLCHIFRSPASCPEGEILIMGSGYWFKHILCAAFSRNSWKTLSLACRL